VRLFFLLCWLVAWSPLIAIGAVAGLAYSALGLGVTLASEFVDRLKLWAKLL
jgi:hypothetical protein